MYMYAITAVALADIISSILKGSLVFGKDNQLH